MTEEAIKRYTKEELVALARQQEATSSDDCECEQIEHDPWTGEDDLYHYVRICPETDQLWWTLHCAHDGVQNPCHHCGKLHPEDTQRPFERFCGTKAGWLLCPTPPSATPPS